MNSHEIENNIKRIFENFSKENFLFDLLLAYGISKTSITRLKNGDFNLSKVESEILYKKKLCFREEEANKLYSTKRIRAMLPPAAVYIRYRKAGVFV